MDGLCTNGQVEVNFNVAHFQERQLELPGQEEEELTMMAGEQEVVFNNGIRNSDIAGDYSYASLSTPPPRSAPTAVAPSSNWTVLSSLQHSAILGEQKTKMPLTIRVRYTRVLAGAAVSVALLLILVSVFASGVPIATRTSVASVAVLNEYNFITGTVAGMLAKPFEMVLALFVPVLGLVLAPRNSLQNESMAWRMLIFCAEGTLGALLTGAFSTLNVQQLDPVVEPTIIVSDLSSSSSFASSVGASSDLVFALRPTSDTLLRTAMLPVDTGRTESVCQGRGGWPNIATTYDFFANDWLVDVLPGGHDESFSLYTSLGSTTAASSSASDVRLGNFNASLSGNLLLYMMFFSQTLLAWDGLSYLGNSSLAQFQEEISSWRTAADTKQPQFQDAASTTLTKILSEQSTRLGLHFDTAAAAFNATHVRLSDETDFDAVTLEIPFDEHAISSSNMSTNGSNSTLVQSLSSLAACGNSACLIPPPNSSFSATAALGDTSYTQWNVEPQIQAFAACVFEDGSEFMTIDYLHGGSCTGRSSTSFLVYSFGRRAVADEMSLGNSSSPMVTVTNLQRYHTITMGRLSWRTKDLASEFNAVCGVDGNGSACNGLTFPLANGSLASSTRHLVVGEAHLLVDSLGEFDGLYSQWTPLAMVTTPNNMQGDLLFHQNVRDFRSDDWKRDLDGQCSTRVDVFATQVEQNHWYMSYGLQEAYTAALFLLFQNAVVREEATNVGGDRTLHFAGSRTSVTLQARIPLQSALISIVGSLIVIVGAVYIVIAGRRQEATIQRDLRAEEIAKVLLVDHRFPRTFLECTLSDLDACVSRPLHEFRIEAVVLRQVEREPSSAKVFIRYPPRAQGSGSSC